MAAYSVNYIDFTLNNGVVLTSIGSRRLYICNKSIQLSNEYIYYETDCGNTWEYSSCILKQENRIDLTDPNATISEFRENSIESLINQRHTAPLAIIAGINGSVNWLKEGHGGSSRVGMAFNNSELILISDNGTILGSTYPDYIDLTGDIRVATCHHDHVTGSISYIYTSSPNFTLKQNLVDAGYTNIIPLYDYLTGSVDNKAKSILKVY